MSDSTQKGNNQKETRKLFFEILVNTASSGLLFTFIAFVTGFLSTKAHMNMLGIPPEIVIPMDVYLQNSFKLIVQILMNLNLIIIYIAPFVLLTFYILKRFNISDLITRKLQNIQQSNKSSLLLIVIIIYIIALIAALYPFLKYVNDTDLLFNNQESSLIFLKTSNKGELYFFILESIFVFSIIMYLLLIKRIVKNNRYSSIIFSTVIIILLLGQFFLLSIDYGILVMSDDYHQIEFLDKERSYNKDSGTFYLLSLVGQNELLIYNKSKREIVLISKPKKDFILKKRKNIFGSMKNDKR